MTMIKKEDIKKSIKTFKEWDNKSLWNKPTGIFKQHTLEKSENALKTAQYILRIMEDPKAKDFFNADNYNGTLWIINASYYSIFFLTQYLLALDNKKLPENTEDTHKTVELALMYYFIIKGSKSENKPDLKCRKFSIQSVTGGKQCLHSSSGMKKISEHVQEPLSIT